MVELAELQSSEPPRYWDSTLTPPALPFGVVERGVCLDSSVMEQR